MKILINLHIMILFFCLFVSSFASADLHDRLNMEEALKNRLVAALKINDKSVQLTLKIDFIKYETTTNLPGTHQLEKQEYYPDKIETSDIRKISISYFSEQPQISSQQKEIIYSLVPIEKNKLKIIYKNIVAEQKIDTSIKAEDLDRISTESVQYLAKILAITLGCATFIFGLAYLVTQKKNRSSLKQELNGLSSGLGVGLPSAQFSSSVGPVGSRGQEQGGNFNSIVTKPLEYSTESLVAVFSDFYWCEKDQEAHYLWNQLSNEQKNQLLQKLSYLYDYVNYFIGLSTYENDSIKHPYYMRPLKLEYTAQVDLLQAVQKDKSLWKRIGPIRQQALNLSIEEKLNIANSSDLTKLSLINDFKVSALRSLPQKFEFGEISFEDEIYISNNKELISDELKSYIPSLVWLSFSEPEQIAQVLEKYDARFLSKAWVAAPEILEKLESNMPESKKTLVQSYLKTVQPQKSSIEFQTLFRLGLNSQKNENEVYNKAS